MKQEVPILVILGNPPYNGFAGMAVEEERSLSVAYRTAKKVRPPDGQGLNDLYVRFYRMAERRIAEKTGRGIVSFISNYSWLDGLSFTGMRERYLEAFDAIRIDCLNGDKFKTGKTTPEGLSDPSIFSTEHNREGIQVGTAIATLIRKQDHKVASTVGFRHLWGTDKRQQLLASAEAEPNALYQLLSPSLGLGLPYVEAIVSANYHSWPKLPELLPVSFPGVKTSRDEFLVAIDRDVLDARLAAYFDHTVSHEDIRVRFPTLMARTTDFDPIETRTKLRSRGLLCKNIVRYAYRPFDVRWLYWEPETELLDRKRSEYREQVGQQNLFLSAGARNRKEDFYQPQVTAFLADHHLVESNIGMFPMFVSEHPSNGDVAVRPNLSRSVRELLEARDLPPETIFRHAAAILHAPAYRAENAGALRMDWPRLPISNSAEALTNSADLGASLMALLDAESSVNGVSCGKLRPGLRAFGLPHRRDGKSLADDDLSVTAGWGYIQISKTGSARVMPGNGMIDSRDYTPAERVAVSREAEALGIGADAAFQLLGQRAIDVHLNADAMWANVPENVWEYTLGGYQVIKKWLSYREKDILGRALKPDEVAYVSEMVRRIAAILLLGPALNTNFERCKASTLKWEEGRPVVS